MHLWKPPLQILVFWGKFHCCPNHKQEHRGTQPSTQFTLTWNRLWEESPHTNSPFIPPCYKPHFQSLHLRSSLSWSMILKTNKVQKARSKKMIKQQEGKDNDHFLIEFFLIATPLGVFCFPCRSMHQALEGWSIALKWCNCSYPTKIAQQTSTVASTLPVANFQMEDWKKNHDAKCQVDDTAYADSFQIKPYWS